MKLYHKFNNNLNVNKPKINKSQLIKIIVLKIKYINCKMRLKRWRDN